MPLAARQRTLTSWRLLSVSPASSLTLRSFRCWLPPAAITQVGSRRVRNGGCVPRVQQPPRRVGNAHLCALHGGQRPPSNGVVIAPERARARWAAFAAVTSGGPRQYGRRPAAGRPTSPAAGPA